MVPVDLPRSCRLEQNFPNPCNPLTTIEFAVPAASDVRLTVYDLIGRPVMNAVDAHFPAGTYRVTIDMGHLPSGVYVYRMTAGPFRASKRLLLLR
ncbi:T9SS type A sorting domain-containing protein [bacterium]|nr:T9SS type A sorting domain-containing protein [bacterium]